MCSAELEAERKLQTNISKNNTSAEFRDESTLVTH